MNKIQTLSEYRALASRTCPDLGTPEKNLLHFNLGIITEVGEALDCYKKFIAYGKPLDLVNIGEELADVAWYVANRVHLSTTERVVAVWAKESTFDEMIASWEENFPEGISSGDDVIDNLVAVLPKENFYDIEEPGFGEFVVLFKIACYLRLDFWQLLTNNIAKLQVRYPEKFTNEAALNRNLIAEREVLESKGEQQDPGDEHKS